MVIKDKGIITAKELEMSVAKGKRLYVETCIELATIIDQCGLNYTELGNYFCSYTLYF